MFTLIHPVSFFVCSRDLYLSMHSTYLVPLARPAVSLDVYMSAVSVCLLPHDAVVLGRVRLRPILMTDSRCLSLPWIWRSCWDAPSSATRSATNDGYADIRMRFFAALSVRETTAAQPLPRLRLVPREPLAPPKLAPTSPPKPSSTSIPSPSLSYSSSRSRLLPR